MKDKIDGKPVKKKISGNKCERAGFEHLWEDTTPNFVYATLPQYPPKERKCRNCGKQQVEKILQQEIRQWEEK